MENTINKVIDNCETFFFLSTESSMQKTFQNGEQTYSSRIYSEIETSRLIKRKKPNRTIWRTMYFSEIEKSVPIMESA